MAIIKWDGIKADIGKPPKKAKMFSNQLENLVKTCDVIIQKVANCCNFTRFYFQRTKSTKQWAKLWEPMENLFKDSVKPTLKKLVPVR